MHKDVKNLLENHGIRLDHRGTEEEKRIEYFERAGRLSSLDLNFLRIRG